ncbi:MAG: DUF5798 family protein [Halococcoides sp.]
MALTDTAKRVQKIVDVAEELYERVVELREHVIEIRKKLNTTAETVDGLDHEVAENRALIEAIAAEQGLDPDAVIAEASIEDVDADDATEGDDPDSSGAEQSGGDGERSDDPGTGPGDGNANESA